MNFKVLLFLALALVSLIAAYACAVYGIGTARNTEWVLLTTWNTVEHAGATLEGIREWQPGLGDPYSYVPLDANVRVTPMHEMLGFTVQMSYGLGKNAARVFLLNAAGFLFAAWVARRRGPLRLLSAPAISADSTSEAAAPGLG